MVVSDHLGGEDAALGRGYTGSVRPVGCTTQSSETPLETVYVNCRFRPNLRHLLEAFSDI